MVALRGQDCSNMCPCSRSALQGCWAALLSKLNGWFYIWGANADNTENHAEDNFYTPLYSQISWPSSAPLFTKWLAHRTERNSTKCSVWQANKIPQLLADVNAAAAALRDATVADIRQILSGARGELMQNIDIHWRAYTLQRFCNLKHEPKW